MTNPLRRPSPQTRRARRLRNVAELARRLLPQTERRPPQRQFGDEYQGDQRKDE